MQLCCLPVTVQLYTAAVRLTKCCSRALSLPVRLNGGRQWLNSVYACFGYTK